MELRWITITTLLLAIGVILRMVSAKHWWYIFKLEYCYVLLSNTIM